MFARILRKLLVNVVVNIITAAFEPVPLVGAVVKLLSLAI